MKVLLVILTFFLQPVLWIGLIRCWLNGRSRMRRTRSQFNTAVYEKRYEFRHFWESLIILGLASSCISGLVETMLPLSWIVIYEVLAGLSMILLPAFVIPVLVMTIPSLALIVMKLNPDEVAIQNYLLLSSLVILALGAFIKLNGGRYNVPRIFHNRRGNRIAGYPFKELSIVPMLVMVPGNAIQHVISFYPTFVINGHRVSLLLVPLLLGLRLTIFRHQPRKMFNRLSNRLMSLGIIGMLLAVVSYKWPVIVIIGLIALLLISWLIFRRIKSADLKRGKWFSEVINGVRIVGIEPGTPAAKMNLHVGDVILDANQKPVTNENQFYEALQNQPTYCRLRVLNTNDRIILTSTAIFNGSPHEIGVVLFRSSKL